MEELGRRGRCALVRCDRTRGRGAMKRIPCVPVKNPLGSPRRPSAANAQDLRDAGQRAIGQRARSVNARMR